MDDRTTARAGNGYRFIDTTVRYEKAGGIVCGKAFRGDEAYFMGHFPGHPIVPGVCEIEMLFQAAARFLVMEGAVKTGESSRLAAISSARFTNPIVPPRDVLAAVSLKERRGPVWLFSGRVSDGPDTFVQASFSVTVVQEL